MGRDQTACAGHGLEPCQYRSTRQSELGLQVACLLSLGSNITNETDFNSNNAKSRLTLSRLLPAASNLLTFRLYPTSVEQRSVQRLLTGQ